MKTTLTDLLIISIKAKEELLKCDENPLRSRRFYEESDLLANNALEESLSDLIESKLTQLLND